MGLPGDLLKQARHLATRERRKPKQASLRRAVSAAYYALFHVIGEEVTGALVGTSRDGATTSMRNGVQRGLEHGPLRRVAERVGQNRSLPPDLGVATVHFPPEIIESHEEAAEVQQERHDADYNRNRTFARNEVLVLLDRADSTLSGWKRVRRSREARFLVGLFAVSGGLKRF